MLLSIATSSRYLRSGKVIGLATKHNIQSTINVKMPKLKKRRHVVLIKPKKKERRSGSIKSKDKSKSVTEINDDEDNRKNDTYSGYSHSETDVDIDSSRNEHTSMNQHQKGKSIYKQIPHMKKKSIIYYYLHVLGAPRKKIWDGPNGTIMTIVKALN